jgi:Ca2+-binding RTX toxin-like protein
VTLTTASADCDAATVLDFAEVERRATGVELIDASTGGGNDYIIVSGGSFLPSSSSFNDRFGCVRRIDLRAKLEVRTGDGRDFAELSGRRDVVRGGADRDHLYGCGGNDKLVGGEEKDLLGGGKGKDALDGRRGRDRCNGGNDADTAIRCEVSKGIP